VPFSELIVCNITPHRSVKKENVVRGGHGLSYEKLGSVGRDEMGSFEEDDSLLRLQLIETFTYMS
jgi:hypothetical protein